MTRDQAAARISKHLAPLLVIMVSASCSNERPADRPARPTRVEATAPLTVSTEAECDHLDQESCLESSDCTLHHEKEVTYSCRQAKGACEEGIVQTDKASCEAREGCAHTPGDCYCPVHGYAHSKTAGEQGIPDADARCTCCGGPPPMCSPSSE